MAGHEQLVQRLHGDAHVPGGQRPVFTRSCPPLTPGWSSQVSVQ
jgi:hypothetical protein